MYCRVRDVDVFLEERGEGRPFLALHGSWLDHRCCLPTLEPVFAGRDGWRRVYPDLPGHGRTKAADWIRSHDDMLAVVLELMDALTPGEPFAIGGFSYGALLARGAACLRPERLLGALLVVAPVAGSALPAFRVRRAEPEFASALEPDEPGKLDWVVWQTPSVLDAIRTTLDPGFACAEGAFFDRLGGPAFRSFDVDAPPRPLEAPALVVSGRFDHWCGYEGSFGLLGDYPLATYAVLDGGGHGAYLERPALFRALVADWLDRVEAELDPP